VGDTVQITIKYQNRGTVGLTNLVIVDTLSSNLIDTARLNVPDAVITGSTVTWRAATNTNLSILTPGQTGQVQFSVPLKPNLPNTIKNQIVRSSISVTSAEITTPIRAADLELPLVTKITFDITGDHVSGASPMQVGKPTTFAITWLLTNTSNDVTDAIVVASLPLQPSSWNNVIIPDSEKSRLSFEPSSGLIKWNVGSLPAFTGKLSPVAKVTFQLAVTPGAADQGQIIRLLSKIQATGTDSFTNQRLQARTIDTYSTSDIDDPQFQNLGSSVK
jgi:hypothetical protein